MKNGECAFRGKGFKLVWSCPEPCQLALTDIVEIPVRVPPWVGEALQNIVISPQIEDSFLTGIEHDMVCRQWEHVNRSRRMSLSFGDMHRIIAGEVEGGGAVTLQIPISGHGVAELLQICGRLGIHQEAWLQGVLGNMAKAAIRQWETHEFNLRCRDREAARQARKNRLDGDRNNAAGPGIGNNQLLRLSLAAICSRIPESLAAKFHEVAARAALPTQVWLESVESSIFAMLSSGIEAIGDSDRRQRGEK